jgi:thiol-disulfide isomerase/thioredoxin
MSSRRILWGIFFGAFSLSLTITGCSSSTVFSPTDELAIPLPTGVLDNSNSAVGVTLIPVPQRVGVPQLSGTDLNGTDLVINYSDARATVINSWATWCAPCRVELPEFAQVALDPQFTDVNFIGLNVRDSLDAARAFSTDLPFASLMDPDGVLLAQIPDVPPQALPSTVIADQQGRVAARIIGPVPSGDLDEIIQWVLDNEN